MSYYSDEWTIGKDIIDKMGGSDYLKLALGAKGIYLTEYFLVGHKSWATIVFKLESEAEYERTLVVKFVGYRDLVVKLVETRKIGSFLFRRTDIHVKQQKGIFPHNVYIPLPNPLGHKENFSYLTSCIEGVMGRCLDPFGMLS
jgi:hypothetical protein